MTAINMIMIFLASASIVVIVVRDRAVGTRFPLLRALSLLTVVCIASAIWLQLYSPLWLIPDSMSGDFHPQMWWLYEEMIFDSFVFTLLINLDSGRRIAEGPIEARPQAASEAMSLGELKSLVGTTGERRPGGKLANLGGWKLVIAVIAVIAVMVPAVFFGVRMVIHALQLGWLTTAEIIGFFVPLSFCVIQSVWLDIHRRLKSEPLSGVKN
jgi:hypothetical protein